MTYNSTTYMASWHFQQEEAIFPLGITSGQLKIEKKKALILITDIRKLLPFYTLSFGFLIIFHAGAPLHLYYR